MSSAMVAAGSYGAAAAVLAHRIGRHRVREDAAAPVIPRPRTGPSRHRSRRARADKISEELAPALQLVIGHLRIGRNFVSALTEVAETVPEPLHSVLQEVITESRLGVPVEEVLERVADREGERHLSIVASALGLQARLGGSLTEILATVVETIEEEDRLRRDIRSLTADSRLSAQVLLAMPPAMLIIISLISPGYAEPLLSDPLGRLMSAFAVMAGLVGWRWLRSLSSPDVHA